MTEPSAMMDEPGFVETVNSGHEAYLKKLKTHDASDSSFPFCLRSAALNLCVNFKDVELKGQLKHEAELVNAVKKGFQQMKDKNLLDDLPDEERDLMEYCQELFQQHFNEKPDESKSDEAEVLSTQDTIESKTEWGMENVQHEGNRLLELNAEYLSNLHFLRLEDIQEQFNNCLVFRVSLYILRERLFTFIREKFEEVIRDLSGYSNSSIKEKIKEYVRTTDPFGRSLAYNANRRKARIEALDKSQFTGEWRTFAICYTEHFRTCNYTQIKHNDFNDADPKDLLEILKNCNLFSDDLYTATYAVLGHRNKYYAHLSVLLIDSETLVLITSATALLMRHIPALPTMAEPFLRMKKPNFEETVNRSHATFLKKLRLHDTPDSDFSSSLSSAAINLCLNFKDVELRGKLTHFDELAIVVRKGYEHENLLLDLSEEEKDRFAYSKACFTKTFEGRLVESQ